MKVIKKNIFENNGENKKQNKEELLIERKTPLSREELLFTIPLAYHIWSRWEFYRIPFQKTFHEDESKKGGQMFLQIPVFYCRAIIFFTFAIYFLLYFSLWRLFPEFFFLNSSCYFQWIFLKLNSFWSDIREKKKMWIDLSGNFMTFWLFQKMSFMLFRTRNKYGKAYGKNHRINI